MDWRDKIRNADCTLCPLHASAEHVCLMGSGSRSAKVMVVGEAPGAREDEEHAAFVGPAGQLLDQLLKLSNLDRSDVYITNVNKCRPPKNRTPDPKEIKACVAEYLMEELDHVQPEFILLLGNSALRGLTGSSGITKWRGHSWSIDTATVFATYHPAYVLRSPRFYPEIKADFVRFGHIIRGEDPSPTTDVKFITKPSHLRWLCNRLEDAEEISFDIETYVHGMAKTKKERKENRRHVGEEWHGKDSVITSIAFSWQEGLAAVVPLHHVTQPWKDPDAVLGYLAEYLERDDKRYIGQNGKFDTRWLQAKGVDARLTFDTMLAAHMLDENRSKGLKPLSQTILAAAAYDVGEDVKDSYHMDLRKLMVYNAKDADYTLRLYHIFREQLKEQPRIARVFKFLMMPASNELVKIERRGIKVDMVRWRKRWAHSCKLLEQIEERLLRYVPKEKRADFNFRSVPQVGEWLFGDLGLPILERSEKTEAPSTAESVLKRLEKRHKAVKLLLLYRKWDKFIGTYLLPFGTHNDENDCIHPTYKPSGTVTGRLSADGSIQQVPRDPFVRSLFTAPKGWYFADCDYSQMELRVAAWLADEKRMKRLFLTGQDMHLNTAKEMTGKRPEDVLPEERKKAKAVNFGFLYTMGPDKFVEYARDNYGVDIEIGEAERYRERYFESYPGLVPWHNRQKRLVHRYEQVHSPLGRVRHLPDIRSGDRGVVKEAERQAINSPVQSTASDFMLLALIILNRTLDEREAYICGSIHDSLLFCIRMDVLDRIATYIVHTMTHLPVKKLFGAECDVPIEVELKYGSHWADPKNEIWTPA